MIETVALDGNKTHNEMLDRGAFDDGSIRLDSSNRITIREATVREFCCDGIVWGISHDVVVENGHLPDGAQLALYSGSGSQRSIVRGNRVQRGTKRIYFCWGAQHGLYEKNAIEDCTYGESPESRGPGCVPPPRQKVLLVGHGSASDVGGRGTRRERSPAAPLHGLPAGRAARDRAGPRASPLCPGGCDVAGDRLQEGFQVGLRQYTPVQLRWPLQEPDIIHR